jgi:hypothetical protein
VHFYHYFFLSFEGIFYRVCKASRSEGSSSSIEIGGFLAALLICAQIQNNDTFKSSASVATSAGSLQELFSKNIIPFAVRMEYNSVLKEAFCADDLLYSLRSYHDSMFKVFEKYCNRGDFKDTPTSLHIDDMAAMLVDAGRKTLLYTLQYLW